MRQGNHIQDRTPAELQGPGYQRAEVETEEREGVFRGRGEPLNRDRQLQMKGQRRIRITSNYELYDHIIPGKTTEKKEKAPIKN